MPFAVKMGTGGTTGYLGRQGKTERAQRRFAQRRKVADGFPVDAPFKTIDDVNAYLSGTSITCLLCGRELKRLGIHLQRIHGISEDDYRAKYGIPWGRGLACEETSERYRAAVMERLSRPENMQRLLEAGSLARQKNKVKHRHLSPAAQKARGDRILTFNGFSRHDGKDAEIFLARIKDGRTPQEVASDPDMPSMTWWRGYRRDNPEYDARFRSAWEALPFRVQARGEALGDRFAAALRECFDAGMSDHEAAEALGVTAMTCNRRTRHWRTGTERESVGGSVVSGASGEES